MQWGEHEKFIREQCLQFGTPLPDPLKNPPELMEGLDLYMKAFSELSTCRSIGMDIGPIPWTATRDWAIMNLEDAESIGDLHYHISRLDAAYLDWRSAKNKDTPK